MVKVLLATTVALALIGCGDNLFSKTTTTDSHDINTTDSHDINSSNGSNNSGTKGTDSNSSDTNGSIDGGKYPDVPTFHGNSQGKILVNSSEDMCYITFAYDCLRPDTKVGLQVDTGSVTVDEFAHIGEVYSVKGHVEMGDKQQVTVTGTVFSGGHKLPTNGAWIATCK